MTVEDCYQPGTLKDQERLTGLKEKKYESVSQASHTLEDITKDVSSSDPILWPSDCQENGISGKESFSKIDYCAGPTKECRIQKEAVWTIANFATEASQDQLTTLVYSGVLGLLLNLLTAPDKKEPEELQQKERLCLLVEEVGGLGTNPVLTVPPELLY
ncbi:hypothetical protein ACRRTK_009776 [Alexandromys fortis]